VKRYISALLLPALLLLAPFASAQDQLVLRRLARDAGLIFSGAVENIEPVAPASPGDIGIVRVTFRVRDALRGASAGEALTISEWDGLWTAGDRYRVGETLLLFLYPPSGDLGLTTTVGGKLGRISPADSSLSIAAVAHQIADAPAEPPTFDKPRNKPRPQPKSGLWLMWAE
jgi:hypothetical protein